MFKKAIILLGLCLALSTSAEAKEYPYSVTTENTNVYKLESDNTLSKIGELDSNSIVEIIEQGSNWSKIVFDTYEGIVSNDSLILGDNFIIWMNNNPNKFKKQAYINLNNVRLREKKDLQSESLKLLGSEDRPAILSMEKEWVQLAIGGFIGWVPAETVTVKYSLEVPKYASTIDLREDIVRYSLQFVGNPYVWGGTSLTQGADCSGFVQSVYSNFGINIPRTSIIQAQNGREIALEDVQPGDLVFYKRDGRIGHVTMYIGNGLVVQANSRKTGIIITNMYYANPISARSYLN